MVRRSRRLQLVDVKDDNKENEDVKEAGTRKRSRRKATGKQRKPREVTNRKPRDIEESEGEYDEESEGKVQDDHVKELKGTRGKAGMDIEIRKEKSKANGKSSFDNQEDKRERNSKGDQSKAGIQPVKHRTSPIQRATTMSPKRLKSRLRDSMPDEDDSPLLRKPRRRLKAGSKATPEGRRLEGHSQEQRVNASPALEADQTTSRMASTEANRRAPTISGDLELALDLSGYEREGPRTSIVRKEDHDINEQEMEELEAHIRNPVEVESLNMEIDIGSPDVTVEEADTRMGIETLQKLKARPQKVVTYGKRRRRNAARLSMLERRRSSIGGQDAKSSGSDESSGSQSEGSDVEDAKGRRRRGGRGGGKEDEIQSFWEQQRNWWREVDQEVLDEM